MDELVHGIGHLRGYFAAGISYLGDGELCSYIIVVDDRTLVIVTYRHTEIP